MGLSPRLEDLFPPALLLAYALCLAPIVLLLWAQGKCWARSRTTVRGCKKLGLQGSSNLADEYHPKYTRSNPQSSADTATEPWRIKALFTYPVKSCAPVEFDLAGLSSTGLTWDRQFCFAEYTTPPGISDSEEKNRRWMFQSLRRSGYERLVHVRPEIWVPDPAYARTHRISDSNRNGVLVINYPNLSPGTPLERLLTRTGLFPDLIPKESSFQVPLLPPNNESYPLDPISIWKDMPLAYNYGRHVPADFKAYLEIPERTPFTLFRASPIHYREVHRNVPGQGTGPGQIPYQPIVAFPDSYPVHLQNLASVRDVAGRVKSDIADLSALRFRPNIIITGPAAYDEDDWKGVRVQRDPHNPWETASSPSSQPQKVSADPAAEPVEFHTACHTLRCLLPNVDPLTGTRHLHEPAKTLRSFRRIDRGDKVKAALGLQLVPLRPGEHHLQHRHREGEKENEGQRDTEMEIRVGDLIEVVQRGELVFSKS